MLGQDQGSQAEKEVEMKCKQREICNHERLWVKKKNRKEKSTEENFNDSDIKDEKGRIIRKRNVDTKQVTGCINIIGELVVSIYALK